MTELEAYYNKFNEEKRLDSRHGQVEFITSMKYIHQCLDAVALKTSAYLNAFTTIAITKLDILDTFQTIKIATSYRLDGKVIDYLPDAEDQKRVEPIYEELEGWMTPTTECRTWDSIPTNAKKYITRMEELIGVKAKYISVGPERDQLIIK